MSNRFRDGGWGNDSGGAAGATQFFGQMLTMPFSAFVYSMQLFIQMLQGANNRGGAAGCGAPRAAETFQGRLRRRRET